MLAIGTVVRVTDKESTFEGWTGKVAGLYGRGGVNGVYVHFTSDYGFTERLMFAHQLVELTCIVTGSDGSRCTETVCENGMCRRHNDAAAVSAPRPEPLVTDRKPVVTDNRTCQCGSYTLAPEMGASPVFTIEAVTGLPNGPMEAHTVEQCFAEVQARADLDQCVRDWKADKGHMFPLAARHPLFYMGTHTCCGDCGAIVDLASEGAYAGGIARCAEHSAEWRQGEREHAAELREDR